MSKQIRSINPVLKFRISLINVHGGWYTAPVSREIERKMLILSFLNKGVTINDLVVDISHINDLIEDVRNHMINFQPEKSDEVELGLNWDILSAWSIPGSVIEESIQKSENFSYGNWKIILMESFNGYKISFEVDRSPIQDPLNFIKYSVLHNNQEMFYFHSKINSTLDFQNLLDNANEFIGVTSELPKSVVVHPFLVAKMISALLTQEIDTHLTFYSKFKILDIPDLHDGMITQKLDDAWSPTVPQELIRLGQNQIQNFRSQFSFRRRNDRFLFWDMSHPLRPSFSNIVVLGGLGDGFNFGKNFKTLFLCNNDVSFNSDKQNFIIKVSDHQTLSITLQNFFSEGLFSANSLYILLDSFSFSVKAPWYEIPLSACLLR